MGVEKICTFTKIYQEAINLERALEIPYLIAGDESGNFLEVPDLFAAGVNFIKPLSLKSGELIPVPENARLVTLPRRVALGYDADLEKFVQLREYNATPVFPAAVSLPNGYLQLYRSAFSMVLDSPRLNSNNYTAVGGRDGQYFTAALKLEHKLFSEYAVLALENFNESPDHTFDKAVSHLQKSGLSLVYLTIKNSKQAPAVTEIVKTIRAKTGSGLLYVNSGVPQPDAMKSWCQAGADYIGLPLNSAQANYFEAFNRGHLFTDLEESLQIIRKAGRRVILNYGVFPGLTDHPVEMKALEQLVEKMSPTMLHLYNLPVDPEWYMDELMLQKMPRKQIGMQNWLGHIQNKFAGVRIGYFAL